MQEEYFLKLFLFWKNKNIIHKALVYENRVKGQKVSFIAFTKPLSSNHITRIY